MAEQKPRLSKRVTIAGCAEGPQLLCHAAKLLPTQHAGKHWPTSKVLSITGTQLLPEPYPISHRNSEAQAYASSNGLLKEH